MILSFRTPRIAIALLLGGAVPALGQGTVKLDTLRWMSGCWTLSRGSTVTDEMWMTPRGGVMLGVARTVNGSRLRDAEFTRIFAKGDTLVYAAGPLNQAGAEFAARRVAPGEIVFENLAHDFPKRIGYRSAPDSLIAFIEGASEGEKRTWYRYARASCS
jgi:uncharacterized protein DUF6265